MFQLLLFFLFRISIKILSTVMLVLPQLEVIKSLRCVSGVCLLIVTNLHEWIWKTHEQSDLGVRE